MGFLFFFFLMAVSLLPSFPAHASQEIWTLETRKGVTLKALVTAPPSTPDGILILFPGGNGAGHFTERKGQIHLSENFLVRSSNLFVEQNFVTAIVDAPSDHSSGMSDQFRSSKDHIQDITTALNRLVQKWPGTVFLVGTSRGTISVAFLGTELREECLKGLILTSSIGASRGRQNLNLFQLPLDRITVPVLFVHHREDGCWASGFGDASKMRRQLTRSPKTDFIEVRGGDPPRSDPCQALRRS